MATMWRKTTHA
uniref:Uncharacterized protein n=1 Tax=Anguilla anguilla TaxID=7936 RepID=A0A0E9UFN3_ANGAN